MAHRVAIIGGGLAGLVAAHSLIEAGGEPLVFERAPSPGGTSAISAGWTWRYRDQKIMHWAAPHGDRALQDALWERLPDDLIWLEKRGARIISRSTLSPLTDGVRIDMAQALDLLASKLPGDMLWCNSTVTAVQPASSGGWTISVMRSDVFERHELEGDDRPAPYGAMRTYDVDAVIFAGGGYAANRERLRIENHATEQTAAMWFERNAGTSTGITQHVATELGALKTPVTGGVFARALPACGIISPAQYDAAVQRYARHAVVLNANGQRIVPPEHDWSETVTVWDVASTTGTGWFVLDHLSLAQPHDTATVSHAVRIAADMGDNVIEALGGALVDELEQAGGFELAADTREALASCVCAVRFRAGLTHTFDGLRVNTRAQLAGHPRAAANMSQQLDGSIAGLFAAGVDVGGLANGGYTSGLAQALGLGRVAGNAAAMNHN